MQQQKMIYVHLTKAESHLDLTLIPWVRPCPFRLFFVQSYVSILILSNQRPISNTESALHFKESF